MRVWKNRCDENLTQVRGIQEKDRERVGLSVKSHLGLGQESQSKIT